ncbi:MAG: hypothetical protein AAF968_06415 [Pseudomonadota bacterium]
MDRFHKIEDGAAIIRSKGVFRQVDIYRRGTRIYAKYGAGFVGLMTGGTTTKTDVRWFGVDFAESGGGEGAYYVEIEPKTTSKLKRAA